MKEINNDIVHEQLFDRKPILAFDESVDYENWKENVRQKYIECLGLDEIAKNACKIEVEIEEVIKQDGYTRCRYVFESEKGCFVPCYLLIPDTGKEKYPVCVCLQGHTTGFHISIGVAKFENDSLETSTFALDAVKSGYAALCIEQRGMGERQPFYGHRGGNREKGATCTCAYTAMTALLLGRTIIGERVWDVSRAIDSLSNFDGLDLDDITCLGTSGGGTATYYSACYDTRIKTVVPSCAIASYKSSIGNTWHCTCNYIPSMAKYFDMGELATLIAPRKLLIPVGKLDPIFPIDGAREVYSVIEKIYEKEGVKENCELLETEREHYFCKDLVFGKIRRTEA